MAELISQTGSSSSLLETAEWVRFRNALLSISRHPFSNYNLTLERILRTSSETMVCSRVGLWVFDDDKSRIRCVGLIADGKFDLDPELLLQKQDAPHYFDAIENSLTLAANDAAQDPRTSEFRVSYLRQHGIGAMLDAPVAEFGNMVGIVCHEHIGEPRLWTALERIFACAIAALASQVMEFRRLTQLEQERNQALFFDHLTGVANRALSMDRLNQKIKANDKASLLIFDMDHFNKVLQALGSDDTDDVLVTMIDRLAPIVGVDNIGRVGDDEFVVMVSAEGSPLLDAMRISSLIQAAIAEPLQLGVHELVLSASVGIVPDIRHYEDASTCLRDAYVALSHAIQHGRGGQEIFTQGMDEKAKTRLAMEQDIRRAFANDEFVFYLQPLIDASTGRLSGAEALLRWNHPVRGVLAPISFLDVAQESGAIMAIQPALIQRALKSLAAWRQLPGFEDFRLSFNLSAEQLTYPGFAFDLQKMLDDAGLDFESLQGEITESTVLNDEKYLRPMLYKFAESGLSLALDDFGTGYASMTHLSDLPIKTVKLDRSYVSQICDDERKANIVRHLIGMAHSIGLQVIAEGVETEQQRQFLVDAQCDELQGYYFSQPIPIAEFEARWLKP
jgi:diguanylate cyclase (GGDEF)-like protein